MTEKNQSTKILKLAESAIMVALATVLSLIPIIEMPLGGSLTLLSMLPICFISIRYGLKWGLGSAFVYSVLQLMLSIGKIVGWGLTPVILLGCIFLDYLIPFTLIGLAGIFRKKGTAGMFLGIILALSLRFLSHFISGVVLWTHVEQFELFGRSWENRPFLYSFLYNGCFMLPEIVMTAVGAWLLTRVPMIRKLIYPQD